MVHVPPVGAERGGGPEQCSQHRNRLGPRPFRAGRTSAAILRWPLGLSGLVHGDGGGRAAGPDLTAGNGHNPTLSEMRLDGSTEIRTPRTDALRGVANAVHTAATYVVGGSLAEAKCERQPRIQSAVAESASSEASRSTASRSCWRSSGAIWPR
jgi:hypothetical protein